MTPHRARLIAESRATCDGVPEPAVFATVSEEGGCRACCAGPGVSEFGCMPGYVPHSGGTRVCRLCDGTGRRIVGSDGRVVLPWGGKYRPAGVYWCPGCERIERRGTGAEVAAARAAAAREALAFAEID